MMNKYVKNVLMYFLVMVSGITLFSPAFANMSNSTLAVFQEGAPLPAQQDFAYKRPHHREDVGVFIPDVIVNKDDVVRMVWKERGNFPVLAHAFKEIVEGTNKRMVLPFKHSGVKMFIGTLYMLPLNNGTKSLYYAQMPDDSVFVLGIGSTGSIHNLAKTSWWRNAKKRLYDFVREYMQEEITELKQMLHAKDDIMQTYADTYDDISMILDPYNGRPFLFFNTSVTLGVANMLIRSDKKYSSQEMMLEGKVFYEIYEGKTWIGRIGSVDGKLVFSPHSTRNSVHRKKVVALIKYLREKMRSRGNNVLVKHKLNTAQWYNASGENFAVRMSDGKCSIHAALAGLLDVHEKDFLYVLESGAAETFYVLNYRLVSNYLTTKGVRLPGQKSVQDMSWQDWTAIGQHIYPVRMINETDFQVPPNLRKQFGGAFTATIDRNMVVFVKDAEEAQPEPETPLQKSFEYWRDAEGKKYGVSVSDQALRLDYALAKNVLKRKQGDTLYVSNNEDGTLSLFTPESFDAYVTHRASLTAEEKHEVSAAEQYVSLRDELWKDITVITIGQRNEFALFDGIWLGSLKRMTATVNRYSIMLQAPDVRSRNAVFAMRSFASA